MPPHNQANNTSSSSGTSKQSNSTPKEAQYVAPSNYKIVKDGWGSRTNFQASYGLKIDPDGLEEGNAILRGFQELDERNAEGGRKSGSGG